MPSAMPATIPLRHIRSEIDFAGLWSPCKGGHEEHPGVRERQRTRILKSGFAPVPLPTASDTSVSRAKHSMIAGAESGRASARRSSPSEDFSLLVTMTLIWSSWRPVLCRPPAARLRA